MDARAAEWRIQKSISMKPYCESRTAHDYWASHLGIPSERLFSEPLSIIAHSGELTGYGGAFALFHDGAKVISLPPERAELLRPLIVSSPRISLSMIWRKFCVPLHRW
jgi:hypothetical protein